MEHFLEFLIHACKDTLPLLPWIFLMYSIIQLLENRTTLKNAQRLSGRLGPVVGAATGLIPQCGFSVMAAKFYEKKYVTVGTLLAIFFSTSDEAFIIFLSHGEGAVWVLPMLAVKIAIGIAIGYAVDGVLRLLGRKQTRAKLPTAVEENTATPREMFLQRYFEEKDVDVVCSCGRVHDKDNPWKNYLLYPLLHTLKVAAFIFLVNFALTAIIHSVGEDVFVSFMHRNRFLQPFITSAIGLIPNCASSVVITETFLGGGITFGSCAAGLCANAGLGFVVLLKNVRRWKRNLLLIAFCYASSVVLGLFLNILPLTVGV